MQGLLGLKLEFGQEQREELGVVNCFWGLPGEEGKMCLEQGEGG